jgi:hypothetical protein
MIYTDRDAVLEFLGETEGEYVGQWKADQRHGNGVMIWPNGIIYDGRWANNKRHHVTGKLIYPNGNVYEGGWVEEKMQGVGTLTIPFSLKFTSRYISGNPEQSGILEYDGHTYEGECVDMKPHGRGKLRLKSGDVYEGDMKYGNMTGLGKILYLNGGWYTGEVYNGTRSGKGKMVYTNGSVYEGFWDKDMRNGLGSFTDKHGVILYAGEWKEDRQEGKAVVKGKPRTRTRLVMKV